MKARLQMFWKYRFLLQNLIERDIKIKYRRSKLGILWSVLNPLLMMLVMTAVFSHFFRFDIPNYPVYLLSGQLLFTFFNDGTTAAMGSVLFSAPLIKKVYVPKYVFPVEKCCFMFINLGFSLIALFGVMLITRTPIRLSILAGIIPLVCLFIFCMGVGLFLSAAAVYFRDIMHFWSIIVMALMYATPIFYPESIWDGTVLVYLGRLNPMYWYVATFRSCVILGKVPPVASLFYCAFFAVVALVVGRRVFQKTQDNFILYI